MSIDLLSLTQLIKNFETPTSCEVVKANMNVVGYRMSVDECSFLLLSRAGSLRYIGSGFDVEQCSRGRWCLDPHILYERCPASIEYSISCFPFAFLFDSNICCFKLEEHYSFMYKIIMRPAFRYLIALTCQASDLFTN